MLPFEFLRVAPYPDGCNEEAEHHDHIPAVTDATTEYAKGHLLWEWCDNILEKDNGMIQQFVRQYAPLESPKYSHRPEWYDEEPSATFEQHGGLSFRMLRRIEDLHKAYACIPTYLGEVPVQGKSPFIVALLQTALRRLHIKTSKERIWHAAKEWKRELDRLTECQAGLEQFLYYGAFDSSNLIDERGMKAWKRFAVAKYFAPKTCGSEKYDRLRVRRDAEKTLVQTMNRVVDYMACVDGKRWIDSEPDLDSEAWKVCLGTVEQFYSLQGEGIGIFMKIALAGAMWRFIFSVQRDWEKGSLEELVAIYGEEILRVKESRLTSKDGK
ncbi:hypothetical protein PT974_05650 [Cladobotryum mycophilum]|uniref:Uncharacterized protein n=1 Tax=Cladobotryum mycophilum TaxID=491253 RepID=A0ABR0SJB2_9HYPO